MSRTGTVLKVVGAGLGLLALAAIGVVVYMKVSADSRLSQTYETHLVDFPVPYPLTEAELADLRAQRAAAAAPAGAAPAEPTPADGAEPAADPLAGLDLGAIALERAVARGQHLVESRYVCIECHGKSFEGGVMIDDPAMGQLLGPNLTLGKGSRTLEYKVSDWDRIVRHGVKPDGTPAVMPSEDFFKMSDRELSDVIAYVRSKPPVDAEVAPVKFGPIGTALVATDQIHISAELLADHQAPHAELAPPPAVDAEFGQHVAQVCTGCHRADLSGGPIRGGDPSWAPAANLTPDEQGLAGWTYEDFENALRKGVSKDGRQLLPPMSMITPYASNMTDTEMRALWAYLQTVEPKADGT